VEPFRFKRFVAAHGRSAMQISTDSVLLGAWVHGPEETPLRILDVGTGCGILALMMAQRFPDACIDAVEIDEDSAQEAAENMSCSPWADRLQVHHADFRHYLAKDKYDLIITNPPYFHGSLKNPDRRRSIARHGGKEGLTHEALLTGVSDLLAENGVFALVLPFVLSGTFFPLALQDADSLYLRRYTRVYTRGARNPVRILAEMGRKQIPVKDEMLSLYGEGVMGYSPQYVELVRDFYLWA